MILLTFKIVVSLTTENRHLLALICICLISSEVEFPLLFILNKLNTHFLAICHFWLIFFFSNSETVFFFFASCYITTAFPDVISSNAFKHTLPLPSRDWVKFPSLPRVNVYTKYSKPVDLWFEHSDQGWL